MLLGTKDVTSEEACYDFIEFLTRFYFSNFLSLNHLCSAWVLQYIHIFVTVIRKVCNMGRKWKGEDVEDQWIHNIHWLNAVASDEKGSLLCMLATSHITSMKNKNSRVWQLIFDISLYSVADVEFDIWGATSLKLWNFCAIYTILFIQSKRWEDGKGGPGHSSLWIAPPWLYLHSFQFFSYHGDFLKY